MHGLGILEEEIECPWQDHEVGEEDPAEKEDKSEGRDRQEDALLGGPESREEEVSEERHQDRKGEDDPGVEGELQRDGHGVGDPEGLEGVGPDGIDGHERALEQGGQEAAEEKGSRHGRDHHAGHADQHDPEVRQVVEERTLNVVLFPEGKDAAGIHASYGQTQARSLVQCSIRAATFAGEGAPVAERAASERALSK